MVYPFTRPLSIVALACGVLAGVATAPASATAIYDAEVQATLKLVGYEDEEGNAITAPSDLSVTVDAQVFVSFTDSFGTGTANATGDALGSTADMQPNETVDLTSHSSGNASLPDGFGLSSHDPEAFVTIENFSSQTVRAIFELSYSWSLGISVDDLANEDAAAELYVDIVGGILGFNNDSDVDVLFEEFLDSFDLAGPGTAGASGGDSFVFSILLMPGDVAAIDMFIGTFGFADAFVPTPSALLIALPGLLLLGAFRRKRRPG